MSRASKGKRFFGATMILIKNRIIKIKINQNKIKKSIQTILDHLKYNNFDIGILFTTNATIQQYNNQYRKKNTPTDVLSFPFHTDLKAGKKIKVLNETDKNLGDIIISLERVQKDANELETPFEKHLNRILVHGICHLIGYDHLKDTDYKIMQAKENQLLKLI
ncbi:MAG: Metalloprotease C21orf57 [candidate division TM6 bacterium GW2011_GWF2_32_72]|nr:MAG: Metalloprotease C21orf57 [candidate division TM6 bacterium GW2011_GWF2_32_72]